MLKTVVRPVLALGVGALLLTGCTSEKAGTGVPAPSSTSSGAASSAPSGSAVSGGASTASIEPCSLVNAADFASYGTFGEPVKAELAGARACTLVRQIASASEKTLTIGVGVRDAQGIDTVNDAGGGITPGKVNGRQAVQAPGSTNSCTLALAVGSASRVDVNVVGTTASQACEVAAKAADIVEPKLPKG